MASSKPPQHFTFTQPGGQPLAFLPPRRPCSFALTGVYRPALFRFTLPGRAPDGFAAMPVEPYAELQLHLPDEEAGYLGPIESWEWRRDSGEARVTCRMDVGMLTVADWCVTNIIAKPFSRTVAADDAVFRAVTKDPTVIAPIYEREEFQVGLRLEGLYLLPVTVSSGLAIPITVLPRLLTT